MDTTIVPSYNEMILKSIQEHWFLDSMSDYGVFTLQYKDVARIIEKLHILFEEAGIKPGDKIALCGRNLSRWGAAFFSVLTYGAVAVPVLHEFHPSQVHDIINHSEAKLLFVGDKVWPALNADEMPDLLYVTLSAARAKGRENESWQTCMESVYMQLDHTLATLISFNLVSPAYTASVVVTRPLSVVILVSAMRTWPGTSR